MKEVFDFLGELKGNNNREWFENHRGWYETALSEMITFADEVLFELQKVDVLETPNGKKSLQRIYRDTRFSKDKTPYKMHWGGRFVRATRQRRGGYYFHIQPGNCFLAGGFWNPNAADLQLIREHLNVEGDRLLEITNNTAFKSVFNELKGEKLKTGPKGFEKDSPYADLLKYKQFLLVCPLKDSVFTSDKRIRETVRIFSEMRPFFDLMSEFLTTDTNGIELV